MKILLTLLILSIGVFAFADPNSDSTSNIIQSPMSRDGYKIGSATTHKLAFYDVATPVDQPDALTAQWTTITHVEPSADDFAIQELTSTTPFGFVNANEANTAMKVLLNIQTKQAQIEARLEELGLVNGN